jgi:hypothetical protein
MVATAVALQKAKRQALERRQVCRPAPAIDDDPTVYPDYEQMGREPTESDIAEAFEPVLRRYLTERGVACYVGSDNFIYYVKGNNKECVSPDVYVLSGISGKARPRSFAGSKDEGCWKTWIHRSVPTFALEVKAWDNPRKDELQSPVRHDGLGTKELIVFDPFANRRRAPRKRFVVYRRNTAGRLVAVLETNDDRVYSKELDAFVVVDGGDELTCMLRLGVGKNGERPLPFESELVDIEAQRANDEARRADDEARRADDEARRADDATRVVEQAVRRMAELEAELEHLRASAGKRRKR